MNWNSSKSLPPEFKTIPHRVYNGDPYWIPEAADRIEQLFGLSNPFFSYGTATVAVEDETARLAAFFNLEARIDGQRAAFFGFWETLDDRAANKRLFSEIERWAAEQGAEAIYGPINFSTFRDYRIRVSASPASGCFPGEPYNPTYYRVLLESLGYTCVASYVSMESGGSYEEVVRDLLQEKAAFIEPPGAGEPTIEPLTAEFWIEHLKEMYELVEVIFQNNFAYTSISYEEFVSMLGPAFARRFCPRTSLVARQPSGEVIGFFITFPDYSPLVRQGRQDRLSLAEIRYEDHFEQLTRPVLLAKTLGVHPEYRRQGLLNQMGTIALKKSVAFYDGLIACLMKEDNYSTRYWKPFADRYRRYALYSKKLD